MCRKLHIKAWWRGINAQVENFVKTCHGYRFPREPVVHTPLPTEEWIITATDSKAPLPTGHHLCCVVDYYFKFLAVNIIKVTSANKINDMLTAMFSHYFLPRTLVSDNIHCFVSEAFNCAPEMYHKKLSDGSFDIPQNVSYHLVTALWLKANGTAE
jgi:hypothetical protein